MRLVQLVFSLLFAASVLLAQLKPITKQGLTDALRIGGLRPAELVGYVKQRGVDFQMSRQDETDLRNAGAQTDLIAAVRASYRGVRTAPAPAPSKPRVAPTPETPPPAPAPEPSKPEPPPPTPKAEATPPPQPEPPPAPKPAPRAAKASVESITDVKRIYVDTMPEGLDAYIRAEIAKQLKGRMEVVLRPEQADAIMTGVSDQKTGTGAVITGRYLGLHDNATGAVTIVDRNKVKILWAEEAGDRSLLFGPFKRGGPRKVADRLVGKLKKVL